MRDQGPSLAEAAPYIELFRDRLVVVKLGGELLIGEQPLARIAPQLAVLHCCGLRVIVVHGGGAQVDAACVERGIEVRKVAGRRVTSPAAMAVVLDVVAGELNRAIVERLRDHGLPARGFDDGLDVVAGELNRAIVERLRDHGLPARGFDDGLDEVVRCVRRPPVEIDGELVDFGDVGDVVGIDGAPLADGIAVLPSVGVEQADPALRLNVNADTIAARVAERLGAHKLLMLSSVAGVMTSPDAAGPISRLDEAQARELIASGQISGGMRAKVEEALRALAGGVAQVHVISGVEPHTLLREIFTEEGCGTLLARPPA